MSDLSWFHDCSSLPHHANVWRSIGAHSILSVFFRSEMGSSRTPRLPDRLARISDLNSISESLDHPHHQYLCGSERDEVLRRLRHPGGRGFNYWEDGGWPPPLRCKPVTTRFAT